MVICHAIHQRMMMRCLSLWWYLCWMGIGTANRIVSSASWLPPPTTSGRFRNDRRGSFPSCGFVIPTLKQSSFLQSQRSNESLDIDSLLMDMGLQPVTGARKKQKTSSTRTKKRSQQPSKSTAGISTIAVSDNTDGPTTLRQNFPRIPLKTQLEYARNGHTVLRNFINEKTIPYVWLNEIRTSIQELTLRKELQAWQQKVEVAASNSERLSSLYDARSYKTVQDCQDALREMGVTASLPFLQYFNTWRTIPQIRDLAFALGEAASILLDAPRVRLYQDAVFWKRRHDGPTPWHVDARMAPFDTAHIITFWIPLDPIPREGGTALTFCSKSHADFALPYWNPITATDNNVDDNEWDRLAERYPKRLVHYMPMTVGDMTAHSGWTLHCSDGNSEGLHDRLALAISYVDGDAEIRPNWETTGDNEDRWSYEVWCKSVTPRTRIHHDLVPIVWPPQ